MRWSLRLSAGSFALSAVIAPLAVTPLAPADAVSSESDLCAADFAYGSTDETCLAALSLRIGEAAPQVMHGSGDSVEIAANAVQQAVASGHSAGAESFIADATDDLSVAAVDTLGAAFEETASDPATAPVTPTVEATAAETSTAVAASGIGNPKYQTIYVDYWNARSDGKVVLISTTRLEFFHYIGLNSSDWGDKALAVHLTRSAGRDTYYSDVDCEMRHVDLFSDSTVLTWGRCRNPDHNSVNNFDMYRYERDYYGNRGDKYYNEIWFDINPAGAAYDTLRANREGPKWKNPDGGGKPFWL